MKYYHPSNRTHNGIILINHFVIYYYHVARSDVHSKVWYEQSSFYNSSNNNSIFRPNRYQSHVLWTDHSSEGYIHMYVRRYFKVEHHMYDFISTWTCSYVNFKRIFHNASFFQYLLNTKIWINSFMPCFYCDMFFLRETFLSENWIVQVYATFNTNIIPCIENIKSYNNFVILSVEILLKNVTPILVVKNFRLIVSNYL